MITKEQFKNLIDRYVQGNNKVAKIATLGIDIWSAEKSFYNDYNYVIFRLFAYLFGEKNGQMIEEYIFEQINIPFDELWEIVSKEQI